MRTLRRLVLLTVAVVASASPLLAQGVPLTMSKSFSPSNVLVGAQTTMTVTITNPNAFSVTGISFSDTYPAGLVQDVVGSYTCGPGSALFTGSGWAFNGVTLGAGASCTVPMLMHATVAGPITNTTSLVTGSGVQPGGPASATLNAFANIPTLSGWALILLAMTVTAVAAIRIRG